jgi:hypothetical protein
VRSVKDVWTSRQCDPGLGMECGREDQVPRCVLDANYPSWHEHG